MNIQIVPFHFYIYITLLNKKKTPVLSFVFLKMKIGYYAHVNIKKKH